MKYIFAEDEPIRLKNATLADPQVFGEALEAIASPSGSLEPQAVVDAASALDHPLHRHFEWDDSIAAKAHRLDTARRIIRLVRVELPDRQGMDARAYLSIRDTAGARYEPLEKVRASVDLQLTVLRQAKRELESIKARYRDFADIFRGVEETIATLDKRIEAETKARKLKDAG